MDIFLHIDRGGAVATGNDLCDDDQRYVLAVYVHRHTGNHRAAWAYADTPLHFADDNDWLANTRFAIDKRGRLLRFIGDCYSRPTFPNNPELRKPGSPMTRGIHNVLPE